MSAGRTTGVLLATLGVVAGALTGCSSSSPARRAVTPGPRTPSASRSTTRRRSTPSDARAHRPDGTAGSAVEAAGGTLSNRTIPGGSTRFAARPAVVYLPPAARTDPHARFPLLVLLHGTEGSPTNWVTRGRVRQTMDAFAAAHHGRAPVVVMPDINGSRHDDTECVRTTSGADVERYLQVVVPAWIRAHLPVEGRSHWGIAGLSEGATCALVLGLRGAPGWSFVGDFSGLRRITVGDTDNAAATIDTLFGGSRAAYDAHDPSLLLSHHRYPRLSIWFECGASDEPVVRDQAGLVELARRSVRAARATTTPGSHSWSVWRTTLVSALPWFWAHSG